jgi:pyrroloquinoline quinone (PQQ) biosynthesis protein C
MKALDELYEVSLPPDVDVRLAEDTLVIEDIDCVTSFQGATLRDTIELFSNTICIPGQIDSQLANQDLCGALLKEKILQRSFTDSEVSPEEAIPRFQEVFKRLNVKLFTHTLWKTINTGQAHDQTLRNWILETYYFTRAVNSRLPYAIAYCKNGFVKNTFVKHFVEEYDHEIFFERALHELNIQRHQYSEFSPRPGTQAVIDWMRYSARLGEYHYAICSGLLESSGSNSIESRLFYENLKKHYPALEKSADHMLAHVSLDESYSHGNVFNEIVHLHGPFAKKELDELCDTLFQFYRVLEYWFTDIHFANEELPGQLEFLTAPQIDRSRLGAIETKDLKSGTPDIVPFVSPAVKVLCKEDKITVTDDLASLDFIGDSAAVAREIIDKSQSKVSLGAITRSCEYTLDSIQAHFGTLSSEGFALDLNHFQSSNTFEEFQKALESESSFWNRCCFAHPLIRSLHRGELTTNVVHGWAIEFYHFVEAANKYMAIGVSNFDKRITGNLELARHYAEEAQHAEIFRQGIFEDVGFDPCSSSQMPLPTTSSLINRLFELSSQSELSYLTIFCFLRPSEKAVQLNDDQEIYRALGEMYPDAENIFKSFCIHSSLDNELGHSNSPYSNFSEYYEKIKVNERNQIMDTVRTVFLSYWSFLSGILHYYSKTELLVTPRRSIFIERAV